MSMSLLRADDGEARTAVGSGLYQGSSWSDVLSISMGEGGFVGVTILDTSGIDFHVPMVDGVRSFVSGNYLLGLEGAGGLVPAYGLIGNGVEAATDVVDVALSNRGVVWVNSDGVLGGWGVSSAGALIPHGLDKVVDVNMGSSLGVAVHTDGTVSEWGQFAGMEPGLGNVVEVDCGDRTAIALLDDGTVVTWGAGSGVGMEPAGLTDVYSVHASLLGDSFSALKTDGTLVTWPTVGPLDGSGIVAADIGYRESEQVVVKQVNALPCGRLMPMTAEKEPGGTHLIKVHAYSPAASYQWRLNGVDLAGETKPFLFIDSVESADLGDYTLLMTNPNGSVETAASTLALDLEDQTIDFPAIADQTFGDPNFDLVATASSGLPVEFSIVSGPATVTGSTISLTAAGTVVVRASQLGDAQHDPAAPVDQTFEIAQLPATVTLSDLAFVYDGTAKSATVVTDPVGLNVVVTYAGAPGPVTERGDYALVATIDEVSYVGSAGDTFSIAQAGQAIDFTAPADVVFGEAPGNLLASASSGLPIELFVISGPATLDGSAITYTGGGEVTVLAQQLGDSNFVAAAPVEHSFTVSPAPQTVEFQTIGTQTFGVADFTPVASATSSLPVTVVVVSGPAVVSGNNVVSLTGAGTVTLRAIQDGNSDWQPAAVVDQTFVVEKQAQAIDFAALDDRVFDSGVFELAETASSELPVEFSIVDGPATLSGATLTMTGAGTVTVRASQAGDDDFLAADDVDRSFIAGYSLAIDAGAGGDAVANPAKAVYAPDEVISVSMTEFGGYRFTAWGGDLAGTDSPIALVMDGNKSVGAEFKRIWNLTVSGGEGGAVAVAPEQDEYLDGDVVTLTSVPEAGYSLEEWQGDASGNVDPLELTLSGDVSITAQFVDVELPAVSILSPAAGITNNQFAAMFGTVGDNHEVASLRWERDGVDQGALSFAGGLFNVTGLVLRPGDNVFEVFAVDVEGNEGQNAVTINWTPDRTLSLADTPEVLEGKLVTLPMSVESLGNVGGMTYIVRYDPVFLSSPEVLLTGPVAAGINQINTDTPGEVRITFALPATTLPAGQLALGTVEFRARSVPFNLTTQFDVEVLDVAGADGNQISFGTHTVGAEGRILQRTFTGDINTNTRLDTGDAFLMQRMIADFEEVRSWDNSLNDLNTSGLIDSGDVIRVLRTVVGLDSQPSTPQRNFRVAKSKEVGPRANIVMDQAYGSEGDEVILQVRLDEIDFATSGASFTLNYPVDALRLTDATSHGKGELVPDGSIVLWNVAPSQNDYANQSGSISFVTSGSSTWPEVDQGGVIAEFVFKVQAGASAQLLWPIQLSGVEVPSEDGFDIFTPADSEIEFNGAPTTFATWGERYFDARELADDTISGVGADPDKDGRDNLIEYGMGSDPTSADFGDATTVESINGAAGIGFDLSLTAIDLTYQVEVSSDLGSWLTNSKGVTVTEIESTRRAQDGLTDRITVRDLQALENGRRFLRVRFELLE